MNKNLISVDYIYLKVEVDPVGIYRYPAAKRSRKAGEYWDGSAWVKGVARTLKMAEDWSERYGIKIRKLTLKQAENLIHDIVVRRSTRR